MCNVTIDVDVANETISLVKEEAKKVHLKLSWTLQPSSTMNLDAVKTGNRIILMMMNLPVELEACTLDDSKLEEVYSSPDRKILEIFAEGMVRTAEDFNVTCEVAYG